MPSSGAENRLRLVTDVLRSFADATTDYARLLETIVERVAGLLGHACSVRLLTSERDKLETAALFDPKGDPTFRQLASVPIPVNAVLRGALERQHAFIDVIAQRQIDEVHPTAASTGQPVARVLVAPLVAHGTALGFLFVVERAGDPAPLGPSDIETVDALARHAALALANARLFSSLEALERAHMHERTILDTVAAPLLLLDHDLRVLTVNRAFVQTFAPEAASPIGLAFLEIAGGVFDTPAIRGFLAPPSPTTPRIARELELATPTGPRTFLFRATKTLRPGHVGETTLVTLMDLTDRNAAASLSRRQSLLISSMNEALIGLDRTFRIEEWNPAAERLFGWTAAEVRGERINDVLPSANPEERARNRERLLAGQTVRALIRLRHRGGHWVDVVYSTMPIMERGEATGYVSVLLDVSERNRLEVELRERVEELTTANRELESFSYSVSHDLRAPVRAIGSFSELLEAEHASALDPEGRRILGVVRRNARRMGLLIDDLLALARFSRQPLAPSAVDMDALARGTLGELARAEPDRSITMRFGGLPPVHGDEGLLRQVWLNLYANAIKYTRRREVALIETGSSETADEVVFTVRDNGAGFDMRHVDKLFGTFERLHTDKDFEGTGIGLALVARIVRRHGGRVWGHGEVDKGATFSFALPKREKDDHGDQ